MNQQTIPNLTLNNSLKIPQLGLGVWQASNEEAKFAVRTALENGHRLIDTAAMYQNEIGVGEALHESGIARDELFVTTKLWNSDQGYEKALAAANKSLQNLGLDYIDLYLIHWPTPEQDKYVETWRALETLLEQGKVRAIGVSNFNADHLEKLMEHAKIPPAVNQIEIHPDFQQTELRHYCFEHGIAVESWSPLGQGGELLKHPVLQRIADDHSKTTAQIVLRWHIQSGLIVIPKSVHEERIKENGDVFDFELREEDMQDIAALDTKNRLGPDPVTMNNF